MRCPLFGFMVVGAGAFAWQAPTLVASFENEKVEALGVCDVKPDAVTCWNMSGQGASDLAETMRNELIRNGNSVYFQFGRKNRLLVVRRPQKLQVYDRVEPEGQLQTSATSGTENVTEFIRDTTSLKETTASVAVWANVLDPQPQEVAFLEGKTAFVTSMRSAIRSAPQKPFLSTPRFKSTTTITVPSRVPIR